MYNTEYYNTLASVSTTQGSWCMLYAHNYGADLSHYVSNAHTLLLFYTLVYNILCPKCIYTYTLYGLFTNVASATFHYYYCYHNNSRTNIAIIIIVELINSRLIIFDSLIVSLPNSPIFP